MLNHVVTDLKPLPNTLLHLWAYTQQRPLWTKIYQCIRPICEPSLNEVQIPKVRDTKSTNVQRRTPKRPQQHPGTLESECILKVLFLASNIDICCYPKTSECTMIVDSCLVHSHPKIPDLVFHWGQARWILPESLPFSWDGGKLRGRGSNNLRKPGWQLAGLLEQQSTNLEEVSHFFSMKKKKRIQFSCLGCRMV